MPYATAPEIAIYSATGRTYGKKLAVVFTPPTFYAFTKGMDAYARMLPMMQSDMPEYAGPIAGMRDLLERVLGLPEVVHEPAEEFYRWYIATANSLAESQGDESWRADIADFTKEGMRLTHACVLMEEVWIAPELAKIAFGALMGLILFSNWVDSTTRPPEVLAGDTDGKLPIVSITTEAAAALAAKLNDTISRNQFYTLFPPPPRRGVHEELIDFGQFRVRMCGGVKVLVGSRGNQLAYKSFYHKTPGFPWRTVIYVAAVCLLAALGFFIAYANDLI